MRIQHNISALNAHRQLGTNNNAVAKNLEKLSSGYAINRAADNAAGLAISEKMRGQIRGLDQAQANAQDGISLIQTAEGALNETHDILQRMRELSVQSANGTYQNDVDRENIQKEVDALKSEIDRISSSTHYNKINLLDGSLSANGSSSTSSTAGTAPKVTLSDKALSTAGAWSVVKAEAGVYQSDKAVTSMTDGSTNEYTFTYKDETGISQTTTISLTFDKANGKITSSNGASVTAANGDSTDTASALKAALEKSDLGSQFKVEVGAGADLNKLKLTAKTEGTAAASITSISQKTTGVDSKITGTIDPATNKITLDLSKIDINKLKDGDKIKIGETEIEIFDDSDVGGAGLAAAGTSEAGKLALSAIRDTATLASNLKTALDATDFKLGNAADSAGTITAVGSTLEVAFAAGEINTDAATAKAQLESVVSQITYTPADGSGAIKGGYIGNTNTTPTNYTMDVTTVASDRYEKVDFAQVKAWDGSVDTDKIEDHVVDVNGNKFLFVKDTTTDDQYMKAALEKLGDVNIVKITSDTPTKQDVLRMAERITEKLGTSIQAEDTSLMFKPTKGTSTTTESNGLTFQIGANGSKDQRVSLSVEDMSSKGIGVSSISVSTQLAANKAIDAVDAAINTVSRQRAGLGALQNRLEHTVNNLGTTSENLTASEARIRDVDMAKEMVNMSKNNILTQAAQAMLAQANTQPQGVLQLLK